MAVADHTGLVASPPEVHYQQPGQKAGLQRPIGSNVASPCDSAFLAPRTDMK